MNGRGCWPMTFVDVCKSKEFYIGIVVGIILALVAVWMGWIPRMG